MKKILMPVVASTALATTFYASAIAAVANTGYETTSDSNIHVTEDTVEHNDGSSSGSTSLPANKDITIKAYAPVVDADIQHVYAVTISAQELTFTFDYADQSVVWNPVKGVYETTSDTGTWSSAQTINITNYSDLALNVAANATSDDANVTITPTLDKTLLAKLADQVDSAAQSVTADQKATLTVGLSGTPSAPLHQTQANANTIGKVTLSFTDVQ